MFKVLVPVLFAVESLEAVQADVLSSFTITIAVREYSKNLLIRNHILRNHRLIFLSLAPFYKKLGRLIYDRLLISFSEDTNKPNDYLNRNSLLYMASYTQRASFKIESKSSYHTMRLFQFSGVTLL